MSTIGNKAATQHVSLQKQTITGNGGTSYTLQQSVGSALDIAVFVNNTRQEPAIAYSASGTTLTMTGAVNASDSFYVIFLGKAITTTGLPVDGVGTANINANAITTDKIADSAVTDAKLSSSFQSPIKVAVLHDEKAYNVYGGQGTAGSFNDRDLNTEHFDPDNIVSVSSNQFTLQAGTYIIEWSCPSYRTNRHLTRLYNVTASTVVEDGQIAYANTSGNVHDFSTGIARVVLTSAAVFKIQSYIESTSGTADFGIAINSINVTNIYTRVKITKLA